MSQNQLGTGWPVDGAELNVHIVDELRETQATLELVRVQPGNKHIDSSLSGILVTKTLRLEIRRDSRLDSTRNITVKRIKCVGSVADPLTNWYSEKGGERCIWASSR